MSPELTALLEQAKAYVDAMTPEQREEMYEQQRRGMARAYREAPECETRVVVISGLLPQPVAAPAASQPDYRAILLNLCASASLADNMGDMSEDIWQALKQAGIKIPEGVDGLDQLGTWLGAVHGATTLFGTDLTDDGKFCDQCWHPSYICECGE